MTDIVYMYTDGACSGNPGPGGWAALLRYKTKEKIISGGDNHTTNNRMELMAVIQGISALKRTAKVELYTDSKYVQQGITVWIKNWRAKGLLEKTSGKIKNIDLWNQLDHLNQQHEIKWHWVKGHSGHTENEIVDKAARDALKKFKND